MANFGIVESDGVEGRWDADEAARARRRPIDLCRCGKGDAYVWGGPHPSAAVLRSGVL